MAAIVGNKFTTTGYTSDNGAIYKIRISNAVRAQQASVDAGPTPTVSGSVSIAGQRRRNGLHARGVRLVRVLGTAPNIVRYTTFFPILLPGDYAQVANGQTISMNGVLWYVESHVPEKSR